MNSIYTSFKLQKTLNPKIWDGVDTGNIKLKPEIRQGLLKIAKDFIAQSLQPKTEWEVEFDENGKLKLV